MIPGVGLTEVLVVAVLVALVFGARRIPEVFRGVGEGLREFRRAVRDPGEESTGKKRGRG